jgi:hypothetical protein
MRVSRGHRRKPSRAMKMNRLQNFHHIERAALSTAKDLLPNLAAVQVEVHDLALRAFVNEVFVLGKIIGVIQAIRKGLDGGLEVAANGDRVMLRNAQREAYRGLCRAVGEALPALGLGYRELLKLHGHTMSAETEKILHHEIGVLKQQLAEIVHNADWIGNTDVTDLHSKWFQELSEQATPHPKQMPILTVPWSDRFLRECGYESSSDGNTAQAYLMLLGLFANGVYVGLQAQRRKT